MPQSGPSNASSIPQKKRVGNKQNNNPGGRLHTQSKHNHNHNLRTGLQTILRPTTPDATTNVPTLNKLLPGTPRATNGGHPFAPRATNGGPAQRTQSQTIYPNDTMIRKRFNNGRWYDGRLVGYNSKENYYKVVYNDGDTRL